jgi:HSP20 family protein
MEEIDNKALASQSAETHEQQPMAPAVDVYEDPAGITLCADMPGVPKDRLSVQIHDDALTIDGTISLGMPESMEAVHAEITLPRYQRAFTLSKELNTDNIQADFENGVLTLRIPKAEHMQPKRIDIRVD